MKRPGKIVKHIDGRIGRTYNDNPAIPYRMLVHWATSFAGNIPIAFADEKLKSVVGIDKIEIVGFID